MTKAQYTDYIYEPTNANNIDEIALFVGGPLHGKYANVPQGMLVVVFQGYLYKLTRSHILGYPYDDYSIRVYKMIGG